ncbi:uncharacterized protein LOC143081825 [Mytilus galloprovincialis]|uniref:uncharacterized protein LOC143081825 n=1 Tax=Mytilus galloprovincialis TaxID=29158 RepID=UPI003F7C9D90
MKVSVCLIISLLLVFAEVNKANEEMLEDNGLLEKLVKRSVGCIGRSCSVFNPCCFRHTCSYGQCTYGYGK